jgi:hypothetical protein
MTPRYNQERQGRNQRGLCTGRLRPHSGMSESLPMVA